MTGKNKRKQVKKLQHGSGHIGKSLSMPHLAGNYMYRRRKENASGKGKKRKRGRGGKAKGGGKQHTQVPMNEGFISKKLRNGPLKRKRPTDGIVNHLPLPQQTSSKLRPQQLNWGN